MTQPAKQRSIDTQWRLSRNGEGKPSVYTPNGIVCVIEDNDVAHAHLIAAAPAMYEALKQTFNVMENILTDSQLDTRTPCGLTIREWESKVRIALAQAEGKQ